MIFPYADEAACAADRLTQSGVRAKKADW